MDGTTRMLKLEIPSGTCVSGVSPGCDLRRAAIPEGNARACEGEVRREGVCVGVGALKPNDCRTRAVRIADGRQKRRGYENT